MSINEADLTKNRANYAALTPVDFMRRAAVQQRTQHARNQHPGLARTGAGLHRHAAGGVAGDCVKSLARDGAAVVFVGGLGGR